MAARKQPSRGGKPDKLWRDALMRAVKRAADGTKTKRLEKLADKLVDEALAGNVVALKEIGDRLDGRPTQDLNVASSQTVAVRSEPLADFEAWLRKMGAAEENAPGQSENGTGDPGTRQVH